MEKSKKKNKEMVVKLGPRFSKALHTYRKRIWDEDQKRPHPPRTPSYTEIAENALRVFWLRFKDNPMDAEALRIALGRDDDKES